MQVVTVNMITAELFPTPARGITIALCSTMAKIGGILSPVLSVLVRCILLFTVLLVVRLNYVNNNKNGHRVQLTAACRI